MYASDNKISIYCSHLKRLRTLYYFLYHNHIKQLLLIAFFNFLFSTTKDQLLSVLENVSYLSNENKVPEVIYTSFILFFHSALKVYIKRNVDVHS